MSNASDICAARIVRTNTEGLRPDAYDDQTGKRIECVGQPTVGYGCRCRGWSQKFSQQVLSFQLEEFEEPLMQIPWYIGCNDARRSALLEIAYNDGDSGLEHGWPNLTGAVARGDWSEAKAQCSPKDPRQKERYDRIGDILLTGVDQ